MTMYNDYQTEIDNLDEGASLAESAVLIGLRDQLLTAALGKIDKIDLTQKFIDEGIIDATGSEIENDFRECVENLQTRIIEEFGQ